MNLDAELAIRLAEQAVEAADRRRQRAEERRQFAAGRAAGLRKRHAARLDQAQRAEAVEEEAP